MDEDIKHLDLLSIFHYVVAGILALFGFFPIIHLIMGIVMLSGGFQDNRGQGPPPFIGIMFIVIALAIMLMAWSLTIALCLAAGRLKRHIAYNYCLVIAAVECIFMPFGTVLGVFTIIVLMRPSVRELFGIESSPTASS